jgi:hypothetical protein
MVYQSQLPFSETLFLEVVDFMYDCIEIENKKFYEHVLLRTSSVLNSDDSFIQSESIDMTRTFTSSSDISVYSDDTVQSNLMSTASSKPGMNIFPNIINGNLVGNMNKMFSFNKIYTKYYIASSSIMKNARGNEKYKINVVENDKIFELSLKTSNVVIHKKSTCSKTDMFEICGSSNINYIKCLRCFRK